MKNVIKFIEEYLKKPCEYSKNVFTINCESISVGNDIWMPIGRHDYPVIALDDEDLKYLYNKYLPFYHEQKLIETNAIQERKSKEIKDLQDKINKIKNS